MFSVHCYPIFGSYIFVALLTAGLVILVLRNQPPETLRILIFLRLSALLVLTFAMLRPALVYTEATRLSATVNLLLDTSESMTRPDGIGGKTRFQVAADALAAAAVQLKELRQYCEVKTFTFDDDLHSTDVAAGIKDLPLNDIWGQETALGYCLNEVLQTSAGKRILGTILISDGAQRCRPQKDVLPESVAQKMRDDAMLLYTVPVGNASLADTVRDVAVETLNGNDRVFVKNNFVVSGAIRINGYLNQPVPVQIWLENDEHVMRLINTAYVSATENGQSVAYRLTLAPQNVGTYKYTVKVPQQDKELIETNNEMSGFVRVMEGGLRVLCLLGSRNFEPGPLRKSLSASEDINVQYVRLTTRNRNQETKDLLAAPMNVFILGDVDASLLSRDEMTAIAEQVKAGAGLIMLGGLHAFGAGGYADTPISEMCPFILYRADRQPLDAPIRRDIHWSPDFPIAMQPTTEGKEHFILKFDLDEAKNADRWTKLPGLLGVNRIDRLKPGATLLAQGPQEQKLLATQMYGLGRVLAFTGYSTYRWWYAGFAEEHKLFWRQIVFWLAKMEAGVNGEMWLVLDNDRLSKGDSVKVQCFMKTEEGQDVKSFQPKVTVLKADNNTEFLPMTSEDGTPTGRFRNTQFTGDYTITAETVLGGKPKTATARFLVQNRNLELDNPIAYPALMSSIAAATGGKSVPPEKLGDLFKELLKQSDNLVEKRETKTTLFDNWYVLMLFVLLMTLEWFLRKHWGLV